jgi:hypothetical protein
MALVTNLANLDVITEAFVDSVKDGLNTGVLTNMAYTPTLTGMAVGTGGSAANQLAYTFVGGLLTGVGSIVFGTTGATLPGAGGNITITLPPGASSLAQNVSLPVGVCTFSIAGTNYKGTVWVNTGTTLRFVVENVAGTYTTLLATSATVPGTWAAGSAIYYSFATPAIFT